jgi:tetratricopeptide (TPR) repeat protein
MKSLFAALNLITVAILVAGSMTDAPAIIIRKLNGTTVEVGSVSGSVTHVDQNRHTFTIRWQGKGLTKMEYHYFSYEQTYRVTGSTVYKNGSWANMTNGIVVRITGQSDVADTVEFTNAGFKPEANAENAGTYNARGFAKQKKGDLDGAMADYNQAIKLDPKFAGAYNNRGNIKLKKNDLNGAMADYNQAIPARFEILPGPQQSGISLVQGRRPQRSYR